MKEKLKKYSGVICFFCTIILFILTMILVFNYSTDIWYYMKWKVVIFTGIILSLVQLFLVILTGKLKRAVIIESILLWLLLFINKIRYTYTYEPLTFSDFVYSTNAGELFTLIKNSILEVVWGVLPVFACIAVVFAFMIWIASLVNCNIKGNLKVRALKSLIPLSVLIILFAPSKSVKDFVFTYVYDKYSQKDYGHNTSNAQYYAEDTMIGGMYGDLLESRIFEPDNYNPEKLNELINNFEEIEEEEKWEKSNIIVTFSESFFDVSLLEDDVKFKELPTPNFNRLKDEGIFVNMISPSYGGVSANVEFEFLTGYSLNFFGRGYTPFMALYKNKKYANKLSLVKELNNNGYNTRVVFGKDYFNSKNVYKYLGMDSYEEKDVRSKYKGYYTSDEYLMDETIKAFENKRDDEKMFYMNCTIESHMPFIKEKYKEYDVEIEESKLSQSMTDVLLSYSQSCYDADEQLGRMYDYIQTLSEPTILVFFGDHLPYLPDTETKDDLLEHLSYFNTKDQLLNDFRKYNTQALVLANFDIKETDGMDYLSPDMLLTTILNKMDIQLSDYYKWLYTTKDVLPNSNYLVTTDLEGKLYYTNNLNGEMKRIYDLKERMQYNNLIDD